MIIGDTIEEIMAEHLRAEEYDKAHDKYICPICGSNKVDSMIVNNVLVCRKCGNIVLPLAIPCSQSRGGVERI